MPFEIIAAREALDRLCASRTRFDAVVACSDLLALQAVQAVRASGREVPRDVAVVGYDDMPLATYSDPPLTTVHQPIRRVGQRAVEMLVDAINSGTGAAEAKFETVPFRIVERASAGQPRGHRAPSSAA